MQYTPLNDYIIIEKVAPPTTTASGIILAGTQGVDHAKVISTCPILANLVAKDDILIIRWSNALQLEGNVYAVQSKEIVCKVN